MQTFRLRPWFKILVISIFLALIVLALYFLADFLINRADEDSIKARINSVEMVSSQPVFDQESVKITNLTDAGFNVVWLSEKQEEAIVKYGTNKEGENFEDANDERISLDNRLVKYSIHSVKISYLKPNVDYFIKPSTADISTISVLTPKTLASPPSYVPISGTFETDTGISEALFVFTIVDAKGKALSTSISTTLLGNESWLASIGDMRDLTTWNYMDLYNNENNLRIEVYTIDGVYTIDLALKDVLDQELALKISIK